ncbi:MAG: amino acid ABC transporter permease [Alcaligenaceae bacterium]
MTMNSKISPSVSRPKKRLSWNDPAVRAIVYQILAVAIVVGAGWYLVHNTLHNLSVRNITTGFGFLAREAGFAIGEGSISYTPADTYQRAITVGVLNTLRVALVAIILATLLGTVMGIARLSKNWLIRKVSSVYVEILRNIPLLLQLFFWYAIIIETMPGPRRAYTPLPGVFVSNRGIQMPTVHGEGIAWLLVGVLLALVFSVILSRWARERQAQTGQIFALGRVVVGLLFVVPLVLWWFSGTSLSLDVPALKGFNFVGGMTLTPEFAALTFGLVIYTSAFIAEVVRSGIQSVSRGQWEAAGALGIKNRLVLRLVVLPQALRVIIPPMTSQYLNITKNSSLAVAIGYPDLVSVINTTLNQTGQAIEGILMIMAAYLTVSLFISVFMNWYNKRIALVER